MCCRGERERGYFVWLNGASYLRFVCGGMYIGGLRSWVTNLDLHRNVLHGADVAGVSIDTANCYVRSSVCKI